MTAATPTTAKIAAALANGETLTARDIAAVTGAGYSTVGKALNAMAAEGKVASVKQAFEDGGATLWMIASGDAAPAAEVADAAPADALEIVSVDAVLDQLAGVGRDSREVEAELDAAAAEREQAAAAKPSQWDRIMTALGMTDAEVRADVVHTLRTIGATVEMADTMKIPANGPIVGDLVAVYAHQRVRVAKVWAVTPTKLSAVYVTPSEVDTAARGNRGVSPNSITAKIADCGLVRSAARTTAAPTTHLDGSPFDQGPAGPCADGDACPACFDAYFEAGGQAPRGGTERPGPRAEAKAKAAIAKASVADGTLTAMGRGDLRAAVLAYLTANRGEITPAKLAKALGGRSSGAVAKGLVKLVEGGQVVQTSDAPKTYRLA